MIRRIIFLTIIGLATVNCQRLPIAEASGGELTKEIAGKDGAPMVLVPAGEFLYESKNQRQLLPRISVHPVNEAEYLVGGVAQRLMRTPPSPWIPNILKFRLDN